MLDGRGWLTPHPGTLLPGMTLYPYYRRLGGPPAPVWLGAKNLALAGIRFPNRTACSESLYRLTYPANPVAYRLTIFLSTGSARVGSPLSPTPFVFENGHVSVSVNVLLRQ